MGMFKKKQEVKRRVIGNDVGGVSKNQIVIEPCTLWSELRATGASARLNKHNTSPLSDMI